MFIGAMLTSNMTELSNKRYLQISTIT